MRDCRENLRGRKLRPLVRRCSAFMAAAVALCGLLPAGANRHFVEASSVPAAQTQPSGSDEPLTEQEKFTVFQLQQQRAQLQQQASQLQQARAYYSSSLEGLLQQKEAIEQEIVLRQREYTVNSQLKEQLTTQIDTLSTRIADEERQLLQKQQDLSVRYEHLRQKLRALSKSGNNLQMTTLQIMLGSHSYLEFLINRKMSSRLAQIDQETLTSLEAELSQLQTQRDMLRMQRESLEEQRAPYEEAEQLLSQNKQQLIDLRAQAEAIVEKLSADLTYAREQYQWITQQQNRVQYQINDILKDESTAGTVAATLMYWPAPGCSVISSSFKFRWERQHYGVDICDWGDSTDKPIVAAADGVVAFTGYDADGYGNYMMIDHGYDVLGRRIITLYGHCSALYASVGDVVYGGETVIAAIGNTGHSYGAHLHFEVRVDGGAVDPVATGFLPVDGIAIQG